MSLLTYGDDDLKGRDIMTLHFINNEKLLPLCGDWCSSGDRGQGAASCSVNARLKLENDQKLETCLLANAKPAMFPYPTC